jgi:protein-disulfide isomerase
MSRRTSEAREKAREAPDQRKRIDRRNRLIRRSALGGGALVVIAVVVIVFIASAREPSGGPRNMRSDGIVLGAGFVAARTPALTPGEAPVPSGSDGIGIRLYVDYVCPYCRLFEETNGAYIAGLVATGDVSLEIHPISIMDSSSQGTKYSTRAANAAACVADIAPDQFYDYHAALFANQPQEGTPGLADEELARLASGFENEEQIASCIADRRFAGWVGDASVRAFRGPLPDADVEKVTGTPTVIVNGLKYEGPVDDPAAFRAFVVTAVGE